MSTLYLVDLKTKTGLHKAMEAFRIIRSLSESELETLGILSKQKERDLILSSLKESKNNKVHPIESIL